MSEDDHDDDYVDVDDDTDPTDYFAGRQGGRVLGSKTLRT